MVGWFVQEIEGNRVLMVDDCEALNVIRNFHVDVGSDVGVRNIDTLKVIRNFNE